MNYTLDRPISNADRVTLWEARRMNAARKRNEALSRGATAWDWISTAGLMVLWLVMMVAGLRVIGHLFSMFTI